jgi:hypothetical protein
VPRISAFYGIVITMYWETGGQHHAAYFHATYGEHEASIGIEPLVVLDGSLPVRALGHVMEWAALHEQECETTGNVSSNARRWRPSSRSHRIGKWSRSRA